MAIKLPSLQDTFKVVLRIDSAVQADAAGYERYLETLDESYLLLSEEPTRFVLRKVLPNRLFKKVQNDQFAIEKGEMKVQLGFTSEEVRCALIGIENPPHVAAEERLDYQAESDGGASESLIASLNAAGVTMDLYRARQTAVGPTTGKDLLKKK